MGANFNLLDTAIGDRVLNPTAIDAIMGNQSGSMSQIVSTAGVTTLIAAQPFDRAVIISFNCTTVFANGDGAQPTITIGQTGSATKFAAAARFTNAAANSSQSFSGILTANTALIVTCTAGTGTTETGASTITAISQSN